MDEVEAVADMAEGVIIKAMNDGDAQMCKWWLAKKRKAEFGDAIDITSDGKALRITVEYVGNEDGSEPLPE